VRAVDESQIAKLQASGGYGRVDTHISWVLIGEGRVYKIKKPVKFSFLDFSTFERRRHFCGEEVRLNARLSPDVYLGVVTVDAEGGSVAISGPGETIDHAVMMRRLREERKMDRMLAAGEVDEEDVRGIAGAVASFHAGAQRAGGAFASPELVLSQAADLGNFRDAVEKASGLGKWVDRILSRSELFVRRNRKLLEGRREGGFIRDCHGDLHSGNVFLEDGIRIIDCIEFSEDFRCIDVASDVAFMAMDLDYCGRQDLSRAFIDEYVSRSGDAGLAQLLGFYKCYRANVRAKIAAIDFRQKATAEARERVDRYILLAERYSKSLG
jgi:aminoglycoside phosphotransferase family enzyme